jgi:hypothetical protein
VIGSAGSRRRPRSRATTAAASVLVSLAFVAPIAVAPTGEAGAGPVFVDVAAAAGLAQTVWAYEAVVGDVDVDGDHDVLLNRRWKVPMRLYRNTSGTFGEIPAGTAMGISDRLSCVWGDPNVDGRPDLFCAVGAVHGTAVKANELWIQNADGTFVDRALEWGVTDPYGRGRKSTFIDADGDPWPDLFVGNTFPRPDGQPTMNRLFINQGGTRYVERVVPGLTGELGSRCAEAVDVDGDGWQDLLVCGQPNFHVYRNDGGMGFTDIARSLGLAGWIGDAFAANIDRDGDKDLVLLNGNRLRVLPQVAPWTFGAPMLDAPMTNGEVVVAPDLDGDRDRDLYVVTRGRNPNPPDIVFRNLTTRFSVPLTVGPSTKVSSGREAAVMDRNRDGRDEVIVVNSVDGTEVPGPLQVIAQQG